MVNIDKIIEEIYSEHYESYRRGLYDFPEKKIWLRQQVSAFKQNNPELLGYKYDDVQDDWVKEQEECPCGNHKYGNYLRMPNNKNK